MHACMHVLIQPGLFCFKPIDFLRPLIHLRSLNCCTCARIFFLPPQHKVSHLTWLYNVHCLLLTRIQIQHIINACKQTCNKIVGFL